MYGIVKKKYFRAEYDTGYLVVHFSSIIYEITN